MLIVAGRVILILVSLGCIIVAQERGKVTLSSGEERPLHSLVKQLEERYKVTVTFEEPPFENFQNLVDVAKPGTGGSILVPRGKALTVQLDAPTGGAPGVAALSNRAAVDEILRAYRRAGGNWPFFGVRHSGDYSHITPSAIRRADGKLEAYEPLLDTKISLAESKLSLSEAVRLLLSTVSKGRGVSIGEGTTPTNFFRQSQVSFSAVNEPARSVLVRLFGLANLQRVMMGAPPVRISWSLLYWHDDRQFFFNARIVE